jgi:hypothetical protein
MIGGLMSSPIALPSLVRRALPLAVCAALVSAPVLQAAETPAVAPSTASDAGITDLAPEAAAAASASPFVTADHQLSHYAANLGRNFKGVFGRDNVRPLLFGAGLALGGSLLDRRAVAPGAIVVSPSGEGVGLAVNFGF